MTLRNAGAKERVESPNGMTRVGRPTCTSGRIERTIPFFIGTEPADLGMDDRVLRTPWLVAI